MIELLLIFLVMALVNKTIILFACSCGSREVCPSGYTSLYQQPISTQLKLQPQIILFFIPLNSAIWHFIKVNNQ